jgi:hypothetical protein
MRKLLMPVLALLLVLGLSSCDLNIFNSFENIPTYSASELDVTTQDIDSDSEVGKVDEDKVMPVATTGEEEEPPEVAPAAKTYVSQIEEMVENDSLDSLVENGNTDELVKVADNLDAIVSGVLKGLNIELDDDTSEDGEKSFEDLVHESYGAATDEQIQELRDTVQSAANAAVAVRLEADPDSRNLVSNSTMLLLDLLASDESRSLSRTLTYDDEGDGVNGSDEYAIPDKLQIRLVESNDTEHVIHFEALVDGEVQIYFKEVTGADSQYEDSFDSSVVGSSGYILPVDEIMDLESEESGNQELVAFLEIIEDLVASDGFGVPYLKADSRLQVIEDFMNSDNDEQEGEDEGDDRPISGLLAMLDENNIDITKLNKVAATFNSIAPNARAFASTIEWTDLTGTEIDLGSVASKFKERTGGSLNGKGVDMVTMSILSIAFDYLFDEGADDSRGLFDTTAFHGFLNDEDLISFESVENGDNDYSIMRIKRVWELLPPLKDFVSGNPLNPDNEDQMEDITNDILLKAGIVASVDGSDPEEPVTPLEASTKLERDGSRLDKLAALISLNASTLSEGHDSFTDLIVGMLSDEGSTE